MRELIDSLLADIPDYEVFLTVDEMDQSSKDLAKQYPQTVSVFEMGRTVGDHPIYCLKIGSGKKNALMFGCPHPNEPIGAMMLEYISQKLATNEELREALDYTWYIVKSWDADGTKLNEGWFKGPYTIYNYARNFFRPAGYKQVDWTFPIEYKNLKFNSPLPETRAMMKLIDDIKPSFIYSLHNAGFGGAYWYISRETREIYEDMRNSALKQGVPLHLGEPEAPYIEPLDPAIFPLLSVTDAYDHMEKYGVKNPAESIRIGTSSSEYAAKLCGAFTLLTELPYFYDPRIDDTSASAVVRRDAALDKLRFNQEHQDYARGILQDSQAFMSADNPFAITVEDFTRGDSREAAINMVKTNPEFDKIATVAEWFDNTLVSKFYLSLTFGLLLRAHEFEIQRMDARGEQNNDKKATLQAAMEKADDKLKELCRYLEENINYSVVPIKKLIAIQLECGLLVSDYLQK